ncbi:MAG: acyltransferase [Oscillospiraceae bacterium]|nr:acyltransferase [Oscillospiraceae bacterium]
MKQRTPALDVIRILAFVYVVSVHFIRLIGFYTVPVKGPVMFFLVHAREYLKMCVPLFMILSGYLQKDKKPSRSYYKKGFYFLGLYVLCALFCVGGSYFTDRENFSLWKKLLGIFDFSSTEYGWYIEMYFGLFLLIPFLNMMYKGAETQKMRKCLILLFLLLTALPSVLNIWRFADFAWFLKPSTSLKYSPLVPDYWFDLYPVTFYLIGAYLRDYPLKLKPGKHLLLCLGAFLLHGCFSYYRTYGYYYMEGEWSYYRSLFLVLQATLTFSFLAERNWSFIGPNAGRILSMLSRWTLGAYLCSEVFDHLFYPILRERVPEVFPRLLYYPLMVLLIGGCSLAVSALLNRIYDCLASLFQKKSEANLP